MIILNNPMKVKIDLIYERNKIMNFDGFKVSFDLRTCKVKDGKGGYFNALWHMFDLEGNAIIELEDGSIKTWNGNDIIFTDNKFEEYGFI